MPKHMRPWLRAIEGAGAGGSGGSTGGEPAGGNGGTGGQGANNGEGQGSGDGKSGDRGSGDEGKGGDGDKSGEGEPPAQKNTPPEPAPKSEPTPKPNEAGEKADAGDSAEVASLKAELAEMKETLGTLTEAHQKDAEEKRAKLTEDVAKSAGLPESMASRLQGDTQEQLEADAKKLAQELGFRVVDPTQGAGAGNGGRPTTMADAIKARIAAAGLK